MGLDPALYDGENFAGDGGVLLFDARVAMVTEAREKERKKEERKKIKHEHKQERKSECTSFSLHGPLVVPPSTASLVFSCLPFFVVVVVVVVVCHRRVCHSL